MVKETMYEAWGSGIYLRACTLEKAISKKRQRLHLVSTLGKILNSINT